MRTLRDLSIQWKLLGISILASGTALLLICTAFVPYDRLTFRRVIVRQLSVQEERDIIESYQLGVNSYIVSRWTLDSSSRASGSWGSTGSYPTSRQSGRGRV